MNVFRRCRVAAVVAVGAIGMTVVGACGVQIGRSSDSGGAFPTHPIRWVVPYGAGGLTDVLTRAYAACMEDGLGQSIVVENMPGGSGSLGAQDLKRSAADGYTLQTVSTGNLVLTPLANGLDYSKDDFTPVALLVSSPALLFVLAGSRYATAADLLAAARSNPGAITVAVSGATAPQGVELRRLQEEYGITVSVVPFETSAENTAALLGGNVDAVFTTLTPDTLANLDAGTFRPLLIGSAQRVEEFPDVPTFTELGYPSLTLGGSYSGLAGPRGLPAEVVTTLERASATCQADPAVTQVIGSVNMPEQISGAAGLSAVLDEAQQVYQPLLAG